MGGKIAGKLSSHLESDFRDAINEIESDGEYLSGKKSAMLSHKVRRVTEVRDIAAKLCDHFSGITLFDTEYRFYKDLGQFKVILNFPTVNDIEKNVKFKSNGRWTKIGDSSDEHLTRKEAEGICWRLLNDYGKHTSGCPTRGHCIESWVSEE